MVIQHIVSAYSIKPAIHIFLQFLIWTQCSNTFKKSKIDIFTEKNEVNLNSKILNEIIKDEGFKKEVSAISMYRYVLFFSVLLVGNVISFFTDVALLCWCIETHNTPDSLKNINFVSTSLKKHLWYFNTNQEKVVFMRSDVKWLGFLRCLKNFKKWPDLQEMLVTQWT